MPIQVRSQVIPNLLPDFSCPVQRCLYMSVQLCGVQWQWFYSWPCILDPSAHQNLEAWGTEEGCIFSKLWKLMSPEKLEVNKILNQLEAAPFWSSLESYPKMKCWTWVQWDKEVKRRFQTPLAGDDARSGAHPTTTLVTQNHQMHVRNHQMHAVSICMLETMPFQPCWVDKQGVDTSSGPAFLFKHDGCLSIKSMTHSQLANPLVLSNLDRNENLIVFGLWC